MLPRDCSYAILLKEVTTFCPCPKSLPEAKVKSFGLILLTEEVSNQLSIYSALWMLVVTLMKICNVKEQAEQGKSQNVNFEEKKNTRKWDRAKSYVQGD